MQERKIVLGFIFLCLPFFDMINGILIVRGFLPEGFLASPSQIGRVMAAALLAYVAVVARLRATWLLIFGVGMLIEIIVGLRYGHPYGVMFGFMTIYRFTYLWLLFIVMEYYAKQDVSLLGQFLKYNLILICLTIIFSSITGLGNSTYGWGFGSKGFFASGNGLGIYLGIVSLSLLAMRHYRMYMGTSITIYIVACCSMFLIGSKTAILLGIVLLVLSSWLLRFRMLFISVLASIPMLFFDQFVNAAKLAFDVIIMRYQNSSSLIEFMSSGRVEYINEAFSTYSSQHIDFLRWLVGAGSYISFQNPLEPLIYDTLETDPFDILFMYGFVGLAMYFLMYLYGAFLLRSNAYLFFTWGLLFMHSIFAGHVIFNGMSVTILAFLLALGGVVEQRRNNRRGNILSETVVIS